MRRVNPDACRRALWQRLPRADPAWLTPTPWPWDLARLYADPQIIPR